uniref:Uncharacterized protein n=1 Tax=Rhizophora mucronata TaxID=61149 RepID=A0A2P2N098_RHIMU
MEELIDLVKIILAAMELDDGRVADDTRATAMPFHFLDCPMRLINSIGFAPAMNKNVKCASIGRNV